MKPGIHSITPDAYYADSFTEEPSLNGTVAKLLISDSPRHAWTAHPKLNPAYEEKVASKFDVGTAAHEVFLLGNDDRVHVVEANDWRTKAAQEVRDRARAEGLIPLLTDQWQQVSAMLTALRAQLPGIDADPPLFAAGKPEQTLIWRDRGVLCRARLDWLHDSLECCDDLKSAGRTANPHVWTRTTMWSIGADIQSAFTLRGLKAALGVDSTFRFVIAETHEPYAIAAVTLSSQALALANAKIDVALERWKECLRTDAWPAYPPHVLTVDPPPWAETQWWEAQELEKEMAA
jgi:hypothetical protein